MTKYIDKYTYDEWKNVKPDIYAILSGDLSFFIGSGSGLGVFKSFYEYKGIRNKPELFSAICAYIVAMYNNYSPVLSHTTDLLGLKREAALVAGFKANKDGLFSNSTENLLFGLNPFVNNMIIEYVMFIHGTEFSVYIANVQALYYELNKMMLGEHDAKTIENVRKLKIDIAEIEGITLMGDNIGELRQRLYMATAGRLQLRPEDIAKKLMDGVSPIKYSEIKLINSVDAD
jgi:hypothetical protein